MIRALIVADSVNPAGVRLTTLEVTFNRYILAELNTHRILSRNSASSRAIPVRRILSAVLRDPAEPVHWGTNQPGMQARSELSGARRWLARRLFLLARFPALIVVWLLSKVGLHKQVANRLLEPWVWHTAIISATNWENFFKLRLHPDAQPEFQELARCIKVAMDASDPEYLEWGEWHTPYVWTKRANSARGDGLGRDFFHCSTTLSDDPLTQAKVSAACCARVSYVRQHDRKEESEDVAFADRLSGNGHFSPLEHPAQAVEPTAGVNYGNFDPGWLQLRKFYQGEDGRGV